jgi:hypothetical protein
MELFILALAIGGLWFLNQREQHRRIHLLAGILGQYQVEKMMETVADGYLRALGEGDAARRNQVWNMLGQAEVTLCGQVRAFVKDFDQVDAQAARFSTLPIALPFATELFAKWSADLRTLLHVHADGIAAVVANAAALPQKDKAYMLTAELLLLQHSCQWYCRSKATASARMVARHRTPHAQLLASVSAQTRRAYQQLLG